MKKLQLLLVLLFPIFSNAQIDLSKGLIAEWNFNDSTATDNTGHGYNGTISGTKNIAGPVGNAKWFNGKGDKITIKSKTGLNFGTRANFSISLWFRSDTTALGNWNGAPLISKLNGSSTSTDYVVFLEDQGTGIKLKWGTGDASDTNSWMITPEPKPHQWHHIVTTISDSFTGSKHIYPKQIFIDGKLIKSGIAYVKGDSITNVITMGDFFSDYDYNYHYLLGALDEVRIYNRVINDSEIMALYKHNYATTSLSGNIKTSGGTNLKSSKVYLVKLNTADTSISAIDSLVTDTNGNYSFKIKTTDTILYIVAYPDSNLYPKEFITYYDSAITFDNAKSIKINKGVNALNFNTLSGSNAGGTGFIGGKIYLCSACKKSGGLPGKNIRVILTDTLGKIQAETLTDNAGSFQFKNLALKSYLVLIDKPYVDNTKAPKINLSESVVKNNLQFTLYPTYLELDVTTGINEGIYSSTMFTMFPNPASYQINFNYNSQKNTNLKFQIYDATGNLVSSFNDVCSANVKFNRTMDIRELNLHSGIYMVRLTTENQIILKQLIINK